MLSYLKKKVKKKDMEEKTWKHITINEGDYKRFLESKQMKCSEKADDRVLCLEMKAP